MATAKQIRTARRSIRSAQRAASRQRTIAALPKSVRRDLSRNAAAARRRGGKPGRRLEDRTRQELYEVAKRRGVRGRSKMGKQELADALRDR